MNELQGTAKIAVNKSLCKEYTNKENERIVYLKDQEEFLIQLFNPSTRRLGADIYIDGTYLGNTLIIEPGQRFWLERYLNDARKFKFTTYEVESGNKSVEKAIANNGLIEVMYYYEEKPRYVDDNNIIWHDTKELLIESPSIYFSTSCDENTFDQKINTSYSNMSTSDCLLGSKGISDDNICTCSYSAYDSISLNNTKSNTTFTETGRTSKGGKSNQKFVDVDIDLELFASHTERIRILPLSRKPYTESDLQKIYCTECGRKLNTKYKFCPYCGTKIE